MKNLVAITFLLLVCLGKTTYAQTEENRTKIQMTITYGGKSIVTDLNSISTSLSRSADEPVAESVKDTVKSKAPIYNPGAFYINVDAKRISDDLLRAIAKKQSRFDGVITIVDTYGKIPTRTIKFKKGSLYNLSDQLSSASYSGEAYGSSALSFSAQEISINGIVIEQ